MGIEQAKRKKRIEADVLSQSYTQTHINSAGGEGTGGGGEEGEEGKFGEGIVKVGEEEEEVSLTSEEMRQRTEAARAAVMVLLYPPSDTSWGEEGSQRRW